MSFCGVCPLILMLWFQGALLGACKIHGAVKLSHEVGKRLLELRPEHCRRYVVLSNVHTGVERWSAEDVDTLMSQMHDPSFMLASDPSIPPKQR
ncbi:hypothetical protein WN943_011077 [Citrus x changshan-huyou]